MNGHEFVTDIFVEKLWSLIEEEFFDFQTDHGIEDGGLEPWLSCQLDMCVEILVDKIDECMQWQGENWFDRQV